jgi:hypothetical protein
VADKSNQIILSALSQAAAHADGLPLHGGKVQPGLFPATALGKQAAQQCRDEGFLQPLTTATAVAEPEASPRSKKKPAPESWGLTEKGLTHLLHQVSPRQVLEDFVRVLEARRVQTSELLTAAGQMQAMLESLKVNAEKVLQLFTASNNGVASGGLNALFTNFLNEAKQSKAHEAPPSVQKPACGERLVALLTSWQDSGAPEDCPLPELFRRITAAVPSVTIGEFHDELRQLHQAGRVYLHPWAGPLYDIPEPPFALLVGHGVAYYASLRTAV